MTGFTCGAWRGSCLRPLIHWVNYFEREPRRLHKGEAGIRAGRLVYPGRKWRHIPRGRSGHVAAFFLTGYTGVGYVKQGVCHGA